MDIDIALFNEKLSSLLGSKIRLHQRDNGYLMLDNLFKFPDGDHFAIYVSRSENGDIVLSDMGHTLGHISYEHDIDNFYKDPWKEYLRKQIVTENGLKENNGVFTIVSHPDSIVETIFRFGQALTKIYDITLLKRERDNSPCTFFEQLETVLFRVLKKSDVQKSYVPDVCSEKKDYTVDYRFKSGNNLPVFVYGIHNKNKSQRTTITLAYYRHFKMSFTSIIILKNERVIPKIDIGFLKDIAAGDLFSIDEKESIQKRFELLAA